MSPRIYLLAAPILLLLSGCGNEASSDGAIALSKTEGCKGPDGGLVLLSNLMGGEFQLVGEDVVPARTRLIVIWPETPDAYWLYEEMQLRSDAPPRQRVHRLTGKDGHYLSTLYNLAEPDGFVGAVSQDFDLLKPEQLVPIQDCVIRLERVEEFRFTGKIPAGDCLAGLPRGDGATLSMTISSKSLSYTEVRTDSDPVELVFVKGGI